MNCEDLETKISELKEALKTTYLDEAKQIIESHITILRIMLYKMEDERLSPFDDETDFETALHNTLIELAETNKIIYRL